MAKGNIVEIRQSIHKHTTYMHCYYKNKHYLLIPAIVKLLESFVFFPKTTIKRFLCDYCKELTFFRCFWLWFDFFVVFLGIWFYLCFRFLFLSFSFWIAESSRKQQKASYISSSFSSIGEFLSQFPSSLAFTQSFICSSAYDNLKKKL